MSSAQRFQALLEKDDKTQGAAIAMPFDVEQAFGARGRVPVRGSINGFPFRGTLSPYGGRHYLGVNRALREGAGVRAGEVVEVVLERDDEPRLVTPPADLARELEANPAARAAWEKLSPSHRREYVEAIEEAKKPETRARRVAKTVADLAARAES